MRRVFFSRLSRRQCCQRIRCTRCERVVKLAVVHRRPRRNLLFPSSRVQRAELSPQIPSLINLRVIAPPSLVQAKTPLSLHARAVPSLVLEPTSDQQQLAPLHKKTRIAVHIVDGNAQFQCSATAHGGAGAVASAICKRRKPARREEHADAPPASIALSSSADTSYRVYCYAVASRAFQVNRIMDCCITPYRKRICSSHTRCSQRHSVQLRTCSTSRSE